MVKEALAQSTKVIDRVLARFDEEKARLLISQVNELLDISKELAANDRVSDRTIGNLDLIASLQMSHPTSRLWRLKLSRRDGHMPSYPTIT